jgi:outer membrane protein assembly factor BamB
VSVFLALIAIAAEAAAPAWQLDFSPKVDWYDVTATGLVMVGNDRSISGVDPETGKAAWERTDLKKVGEIGVSHVPGTPTAMVLEAEYKLGQVPKGVLHLLDVSTGKDLWTAEGGPVMWSKPQYSDKALLYLTQEFTNKGISYTMHYVDLMSGAVKWEKEDYFEKMNAVLQQWQADPTKKMSPKMTLEGNQGIVVVDDGKAYLELWTEKQGLVKRDFATGNVLWSNPTKYVDNFVPVPRNGRPPITIAGDNVFVTDNGGRLLAYKLSTGAPVWEEKDAPKMLGTIFTVIPVGDDVLVAGG